MNVRLSGSFSGVYGTGKALAAALSKRRLTSSSMEYSFDMSEYPSPGTDYQEDKGFILGGERVSIVETDPYQLLSLPSFFNSRSKMGVMLDSDQKGREKSSGDNEEDFEGKEISMNVYNYQNIRHNQNENQNENENKNHRQSYDNIYNDNYNNGNRRLVNISNPNTVFNPVVCLVVGASIIFDVSNTRYPVYLKDSLLNTNPGFDYSSFRQLAALASTTVSISSFAFTFSSAGKRDSFFTDCATVGPLVRVLVYVNLPISIAIFIFLCLLL